MDERGNEGAEREMRRARDTALHRDTKRRRRRKKSAGMKV